MVVDGGDGKCNVSHVWWPGLNKDIEDLAKSCMHGLPKCPACASHSPTASTPHCINSGSESTLTLPDLSRADRSSRPHCS